MTSVVDKQQTLINKYADNVYITCLRKIELTTLQLRSVSDAARHLGSSGGIFSSTYLLRERLRKIVQLFRQNAAENFPRKINPQDNVVKNTVLSPRRQSKSWMKASTHRRTPIESDSLDLESLPDHIKAFAHDLAELAECLKDFPKFADQQVEQMYLLNGKYSNICTRSMLLL